MVLNSVCLKAFDFTCPTIKLLNCHNTKILNNTPHLKNHKLQVKSCYEPNREDEDGMFSRNNPECLVSFLKPVQHAQRNSKNSVKMGETKSPTKRSTGPNKIPPHRILLALS